MGNSNKLIAIGMLLILGINLAFALGVNSPYWDGNPLKMYSEETRDVQFALANSINEPTTEATASLIEGQEIAEIISGEKYTVKPGENNKNIILRINAPENSQIGNSYNVKFIVRYSPEGEEGNVKLDVEYNVAFPIEIVDKENAKSTTQVESKTTKINKKILIIIVLSILIIIILIIFIIKLKQKKDQEKNNFK